MVLMTGLYNVTAFEFLTGPITIPQGFWTGWMIWLLLHLYGSGSIFLRIRGTVYVHQDYICIWVHVGCWVDGKAFQDIRWASRQSGRWHGISIIWAFVSLRGNKNSFTGDLSMSVQLGRFYFDDLLGWPLSFTHYQGSICRLPPVSSACQSLCRI